MNIKIFTGYVMPLFGVMLLAVVTGGPTTNALVPGQIFDLDSNKNEITNTQGLAPSASPVDSQNAVTPRSLACIGDGNGGPRFRMVYAYKDGSPNRLNSLRDYFTNVAKRMNGVVYQSSVGFATPQKFRFETEPDCSLKITAVKLTGSVTGVKNDFGEIVNQVWASGLNSKDRKYVIELDMRPPVDDICGLASNYNAQDDSLSPNNLNNVGNYGYAIVGPNCWNAAEAHEAIHLLGAVNDSTPNSSGRGHCSDDEEIMCYDDDGAGPFQTQAICPIAVTWNMDCNNNDYYNNNQGYPLVRPLPGYSPAYLVDHWNTAYSRYLTNTPEWPFWLR